MTASKDSMTAQNRQRLAIAYLTGDISSDDLAEFRRLINSDTAFQREVRDIEAWLAPLNADVEDISPPEGLFADILSEIDNDAKIHADETQAAETEARVAANDSRPNPWKYATIAASCVAMLAIGSHFISSEPDVSLPVESSSELMALLGGESQPGVVAVIYSEQDNKILARISNVSVPEDGDLQLWLIREGSEAPISLGVLERVSETGQFEFLSPTELADGTDILAVSLEARGGSKSGGPEGPVLYTGAVSGLK